MGVWERLTTGVAVFLVPTAILLYILFAFFLSASVGMDAALGTIVFFLGWLLVGHGMDFLAFRLNIFLLVFVIWLSFILWASLRYFIRDGLLYKDKLSSYQSALIFIALFLVVFIGSVLAGFLLMFTGTELMGGVSSIPLDVLGWHVCDDLLEGYESSVWDNLFDVLFAVPLLLWVLIIFFREVKVYNVLGG